VTDTNSLPPPKKEGLLGCDVFIEVGCEEFCPIWNGLHGVISEETEIFKEGLDL
jgi:hypothetical protein